MAENLSYGHSGGRIDTRAGFIGDLIDGKSNFVAIAIAITDRTAARSQDVVVIRHTLTGRIGGNGKPGDVTIEVLQVLQQQAGQWQLLARQAVRPAWRVLPAGPAVRRTRARIRSGASCR